MARPGRIILINGASSAGKSTLAAALQDALDEPFWRFSFDHLRDSRVLPFEKIATGELDWRALRPSFFEGFHRCLPALAEAGNDLIVEHVIETRAWMLRLAELLAHVDTFLVALRCPLEELERREALRSDRRLGEARADHAAVLEHAAPDLELDGRDDPSANAAALIAAWQSRAQPSALTRLAAR